MSHGTVNIAADHKKCIFGLNQFHFIVFRYINGRDILLGLFRRILLYIKIKFEEIFGTVKKNTGPSVKMIWATQSGYLKTNMPHTGHLSFLEGLRGVISADTASELKIRLINKAAIIRFIVLLPIYIF